MKPKVLVSLLTSEQEFQMMQAADARAAAERTGLEVEIVFAENNAIQQFHQIYKSIHAPNGERPVAVFVEPVGGEGLERVAHKAVQAGIVWVIDQWKVDLENLRRENPKVPVVSVSVDEEAIGRIQAQQFHALLPQGGAALYLQGPVDSPAARSRFKGMAEGIEGSAFELKRVFNGYWTEESAEAAVASWLRLKTTDYVQIDLVGSQNDSMALGARKAIEERRKEWLKLPFTGCDGLPDGGQRMVNIKQLAATIVKPTTTGPAVEAIARTLNGQPVAPDLTLQPRSYPPIEELSRRR